MAIPSDAKVFDEALDPTDIVDFEINLAPLLEDGETITSSTIGVPTESAVLGLEVLTTGGYSTSLTDNVMRIWLGIDDAEQGNAAFATGVTLPLVVTVTTNSNPPRRRQRTVAVKVRQR